MRVCLRVTMLQCVQISQNEDEVQKEGKAGMNRVKMKSDDDETSEANERREREREREGCAVPMVEGVMRGPMMRIVV